MALLRNYKVDTHAAEHSSLQRLQGRFVRYEIRRGNLDLFASSVDQGNDETLVILGRKIWSTRQDLKGVDPALSGPGKTSYFIRF